MTPEHSAAMTPDQIEALNRLVNCLTEFREAVETSEGDDPNELPCDAVKPGGEIHREVCAVQPYYDGKLPDPDAYDSWLGLLAACRREPDPHKRMRDALFFAWKLINWAQAEILKLSAQTPVRLSVGSPTGFLGRTELANALGVHPSQQGAFFRQLDRAREEKPLGDDCWCRLDEVRPRSSRYLYRADAPRVRDLAVAYQRPNRD